MTIGGTAIGVGMLGGPDPAAPAAGTTPIVALEVAFTTDPGATPVWVDVSDYLLEATINRGRSQETDRFRAGTAEIILANDDRRFDPTNTAGPYYPNVLPMRRCRVRATFEAVTYDVFTGYADGWQQEYDHPSVSRARLTATDAMKVLSQVQLPSSGYAAEVVADSPANWYRLGGADTDTRLLDEVGGRHLTKSGSFPATAGLISRDGDGARRATSYTEGGLAPLQITPAFPGITMEIVFQSADVNGGNTLVAIVDETIARGFVLRTNGGVSWSAAATVTTTAGYALLDGVTNLSGTAAHHLALTWDGATVILYVDGVAVTTAALAGTMFSGIESTYILVGGPTGTVSTLGTVGTYDEAALYRTVLSPARIAAHADQVTTPWDGDRSGARINRILTAAGWPLADREIDTGAATLQSADLGISALEALQKVEETEQGRLFITAAGNVRFISRDSLLIEPYVTPEATFGDSAGELEYGDLKYRYDDGTIVNEVTVSRLEGNAVTVRDTASETKYLRRSRVLSGLVHASDSTSIDVANSILYRYKDPLLRATQLRLEPDAGNASTHYPQVFGRELVDRVTVKRIPQGTGAAISQDAYVEAIVHRASATKWKTDWNLSPAAATTSAGVWDVGLWDQATWSF